MLYIIWYNPCNNPIGLVLQMKKLKYRRSSLLADSDLYNCKILSFRHIIKFTNLGRYCEIFKTIQESGVWRNGILDMCKGIERVENKGKHYKCDGDWRITVRVLLKPQKTRFLSTGYLYLNHLTLNEKTELFNPVSTSYSTFSIHQTI